MKVIRFIIALTKYIIWGDQVTTDKYNNRMAICDCYLKKKAKWSTESCPQNKW